MRVKEIITHSLGNKISTIILMIFSMIVTVVLEVFMVLVIRNMVDDVFVKVIDDNPGLALRVTFFVLAFLLWFGIKVLIKNRAALLGSHVSTSLKKAVFSAALRAELAELEKIDKGEIVRKITEDCEKIGEKYIGESWVNFFARLIFLVGIFISMMIVNPVLGLITYVTFPVFYMLLKTFGVFSERIEGKGKLEIRKKHEEIAEVLEKVSDIKLKNGVLREEENFQRQCDRYVEIKKLNEGLRDIRRDKLFALFLGGVLALIFGIGGYLSTRGDHIPGTIVGFLILTPFVFHAFRQMMNPQIGFSIIRQEMASLEEVLSLRSEIRAEPIKSLEAVTNLRFENVSHRGGDGAIEALNFEVKTGEKLGVISLDDYSSDLLFSLLTKIVRPREGQITINNCDINKISTFYLRDIVSGITSEKTLFKDSIANNISYPLEFDEYKYNDALNKSGLKAFLNEFENKDQTLLDEEFPLSEELVHRISFANLFYKDSKIIVLNHATAGLDVKSEEELLKEVFKLKNKIIILMTDKIYQITNCDKVLILENENVLEYGAVGELLKDRNSVLAKLTKKAKASKGVKVS